MVIKDTHNGYGIVSRILHWGMAVGIFALFGLGLWMVRLDYYDPYYTYAPNLHRSTGVLLLLLLVVRMTWRTLNVRPSSGNLNRFERRAARLVHAAFYPLLILLFTSGYFISTADGRAIDVFGWFSFSSIFQSKKLADAAGVVHEWVAYLVIGLAIVHAAGAIKHRVLGQTNLLTRMWTGPA